jgi:hypothetical protein
MDLVTNSRFPEPQPSNPASWILKLILYKNKIRNKFNSRIGCYSSLQNILSASLSCAELKIEHSVYVKLQFYLLFYIGVKLGL